MEQPKLEIEIKFSPEIVITVFGETIGRVSLRDFKDMKEFIEGLRVLIAKLIKEFQDKEKKVDKNK